MTPTRPDCIAVFGSSEPLPGDPLYEQAYSLGRLLARDGNGIVTDGYGGVMEAFLWALHRAGCLERRPVVLLGGKWSQLLDHLANSEMLDAPQIEITRLAAHAEEVVEILNQLPAVEDPGP
jgi:predicted Rossmann-fold nucleotide-binding protein